MWGHALLLASRLDARTYNNIVSRYSKGLAKRYSQLKPTRVKLQNQNLLRRVAKRYSQLKATRAKLQNQKLLRRVAKRYCQVEPAIKKTFNCLTTTTQSPNNNETTWLESALVGRGGQTVENWLELGENLSLIKFKPARTK